MDQLLRVSWKSALIFIILVGLARIIGRKLLAQMSYFDFTVAITIGTITGSYVVQMVEGMWVLISPVLLSLLAITFDYLHLKSLKLRKLTEGEPVIIIQNGNILDNNMKKLRYHLDNLEAQLREKGVFDLSEVEFAVIEPHGQLSVLKKSQNLPVTPKDMSIQTSYKGISTELIKDGQLLEQNLVQSNLTIDWLNNELRLKNIKNMSDVFYAAVNTDKVLYVSLKKSCLDNIQKVED
jgi:uncharacterized membrane protein YcaP (DUF421 family)